MEIRPSFELAQNLKALTVSHVCHVCDYDLIADISSNVSECVFSQLGSMETPDMFFIHETRLAFSVALEKTCNFSTCFCNSYSFDWGTLTVCFYLPFVRDRPNLFYFNFLKCATTFNVMAASLNGLQCPTTQVERTWLFFPQLLVFS